jgi:molecular chaperone HtpG
VKEVRITHRLTDSAACLVVGEGELSGNLERLLHAAGQKAPTAVPILEINPRHALIRRVDAEPEDRLADWANLLFDEALLAEGAQLPDPAGFVRRLNALMFGATPPASASPASAPEPEPEPEPKQGPKQGPEAGDPA